MYKDNRWKYKSKYDSLQLPSRLNLINQTINANVVSRVIVIFSPFPHILYHFGYMVFDLIQKFRLLTEVIL